MSVKYQLNLRRPLVPVLAGVDCVPSYFIVGGLVFVPLSIPFLEHAYGGPTSSLPTLSGSSIVPAKFLSFFRKHRKPAQ